MRLDHRAIKMAPKWLQMAPRWPQDGPKMATQNRVKMGTSNAKSYTAEKSVVFFESFCNHFAPLVWFPRNRRQELHRSEILDPSIQSFAAVQFLAPIPWKPHQRSEMITPALAKYSTKGLRCNSWPSTSHFGASWGHRPRALDVLSVMARSSIQIDTITCNADVSAWEKGGECQ